MKLIWRWNDLGGGAGAGTGVLVGMCVGDGGCASWDGVQDGFASWGDQVRMVKFGCSSRGV
jgi:hypothetical protein